MTGPIWTLLVMMREHMNTHFTNSVILQPNQIFLLPYWNSRGQECLVSRPELWFTYRQQPAHQHASALHQTAGEELSNPWRCWNYHKSVFSRKLMSALRLDISFKAEDVKMKALALFDMTRVFFFFWTLYLNIFKQHRHKPCVKLLETKHQRGMATHHSQTEVHWKHLSPRVMEGHLVSPALGKVILNIILIFYQFACLSSSQWRGCLSHSSGRSWSFSLSKMIFQPTPLSLAISRTTGGQCRLHQRWMLPYDYPQSVSWQAERLRTVKQCSFWNKSWMTGKSHCYVPAVMVRQIFHLLI